MNRTQRRSLRGKEDLFNEVTGRRTVLKEIPVSELKVDESKLDQQLLQKMMSYENNKASFKEEVGIFCELTLSYLDSLCTLKFNSLYPEEKEQAIGIIDLVVRNTNNMLEGLVLSEENLVKVVDSIKDVTKFSLSCFEGTDIPLLLPLCEKTVNLLQYSYVIGAYIGELNELTKKDIDCVKEYSDFMISKSLEIKAKN